ncbi:FadR/GntR family transcriptional regulator [Rothia uropygialis]|uniref:FadR/GntR family transcriptional regulator n=1 Tax=Kocuria sp. 36 TaxID=1415402 RepID=UPI00101C6B41|nr:FCD domain-containing protein [Kocuria sp. 36]
MTQNTLSLSEKIADGIVEMITREGKCRGDSIPSARALAEHFEVTTPTVREALRRLEAIGVIIFRHGAGTFVGPGFGRGLVANPHVVASASSVLDLIEARLVIEPNIAAAAASYRTEEDLKALRAACNNAKEPHVVEDVFSHFHATMARATGNPVLTDTIEAMLVFTRRQRQELRQAFIVPEHDHAEHLGLVEAIEAQDPETARFLAEAHLRSLRDAVRQQLRPNA